MNRVENILKAVELSTKASEELEAVGGWKNRAELLGVDYLCESLCNACNTFANWVANEGSQAEGVDIDEDVLFQGAWVYFYKNHKDWIMWQNGTLKVNAGEYDYAPYSGERVKLLTTEEFNDVTNGKDLSNAIQRFTIHKQLEGETDGELTIERIEGLLEQLEQCKKRLKRQRKELTK